MTPATRDLLLREARDHIANVDYYRDTEMRKDSVDLLARLDAALAAGEKEEPVDWQDLDTAPVREPVLVQYHEWDKPGSVLNEQVAWFYEGSWRLYPQTDGTAFAEKWKPLRPAPAAVPSAVVEENSALIARMEELRTRKTHYRREESDSALRDAIAALRKTTEGRK